MKKTIAMLLAVIMIMSMCVSLSACGDNKDDYVGVWKLEDTETYYMYIYKDGTGDYYDAGYYNPGHKAPPLVWEIEDGYLVIKESDATFGDSVTKFTLSGNQLLDKQGKVYATKYRSDTSVDVPVGEF